MNLRPSGYEPDELPDCSTPHQEGRAFYKRTFRAAIPRAGIGRNGSIAGRALRAPRREAAEPRPDAGLPRLRKLIPRSF